MSETNPPTRYARKKKTEEASTVQDLPSQGIPSQEKTQEIVPDTEMPETEKDVSVKSFKENYATLERIVDKLQSGSVDDIDNLIPLVEEATRAYNGCKARIDAVEQMITKSVG